MGMPEDKLLRLARTGVTRQRLADLSMDSVREVQRICERHGMRLQPDSDTFVQVHPDATHVLSRPAEPIHVRATRLAATSRRVHSALDRFEAALKALTTVVEAEEQRALLAAKRAELKQQLADVDEKLEGHKPPSARRSKDVTGQMRAWARLHGHQVGDRGRIPNRIQAAYWEAQDQK